MTLDEYKQKTVGNDLEMPKTLAKLFKFEEEEAGVFYCNNFELCDEEIMGVDIDHCEDEYYKHIKPFSYTGDGCCAFWVKDKNLDLEQSPIIYYSSEGMIRIMAKNLKTFLRMLSFDANLSDGTFFKFKADYEESQYKQHYVKWLKEELNLDPVEDLPDDERYGESPETIKLTKKAEDLYKASFIAWHKRFCDIEEQYYVD